MLYGPFSQWSPYNKAEMNIHELAVSGLVKGASSVMYKQRLKMTSTICSGVEETGPYPLGLRRLNCTIVLDPY